jgi:hypothetical protein
VDGAKISGVSNCAIVSQVITPNAGVEDNTLPIVHWFAIAAGW